jgi:hypothetical protein
LQLEDAGGIVMSGWSAGARSSPQFDWVRNLLRKTSPDADAQLRFEAASAFALLWNLCQALLPPEVIQDFRNFIDDSGIYRMDPSAATGNPAQQYEVLTEEGPVLFRNAEMAPPCGVFARNYARLVSALAEFGFPSNHLQTVLRTGRTSPTSGQYHGQQAAGALKEMVDIFTVVNTASA